MMVKVLIDGKKYKGKHITVLENRLDANGDKFIHSQSFEDVWKEEGEKE